MEIVKIADLSINMGIPAVVVGVVIAKQSGKQFTDKSNNVRCVMSFTVRDSPGDLVNCTVWGSKEYVDKISQQFYTHDIVQLHKFQVQLKSETEDKFNPVTTSCFTVHLSERSCSKVNLHDDIHGSFDILRHALIRPENDYYKIAEINEQSTSINGQSVNLLAIVKKVGKLQHLTAKTGKNLTKLHVQLFDETCSSFSLTIWDCELAQFAMSWANRNTVLFACDVRVGYNEYSKCMAATATSKTIILPNPDSLEAHKLFQYAKQYDEQISSLFDETMEVDDDKEPEIYTVSNFLKLGEERKRMQMSGSVENIVLCGIVFGAITSFDIDGPGRNIWSYRCGVCRRRMQTDDQTMCSNAQCPSIIEGAQFSIVRCYDMIMALSDHTGTLEHCRIGGTSIERMFQMSVEEYQKLSSIEVTKLKWQWLLERCKVTVRCSFEYDNPYVRIEKCEKSDPAELIMATSV